MQSCTSDSWSYGNDDKEPHRDIKNYPWEHYYKQTKVGSCLGLSNDPEESPRHKTLKTENFTAWFMNRDPLLK